jgi:hypothetical protein
MAEVEGTMEERIQRFPYRLALFHVIPPEQLAAAKFSPKLSSRARRRFWVVGMECDAAIGFVRRTEVIASHW